MIMSKSKMINNQKLKNLFLANEPNNQFHVVNFNNPKHEINWIIQNDFIPNNNNGGKLEPFQAFLSKCYERSKDLLNNSQSSFNNIYNNTPNINKDNDMLSDINN